MRSLEQLDRFIAGLVHRWAAKVSGGPQPPQLLEIRREILHDVSARIEPRGDGEYVFPFNHIDLTVFARSEDARPLLESAFSEGSLEKDILALLAGAGVRLKHLTVAVRVMTDEAAATSGSPFAAEYVRTERAAKSSAGARPPARLMVLRGRADVEEFRIEHDRVNIGRMKEVASESGGLRRRNDVAFAEEETTVSREHARIVYESDSGRFRLSDEASQRGVAIFRGGRRIEVPRGGRGVQLESGDEIHLGNARLRFEILPETD